jgi:U2 small nuclear ribonucleoprotein B''
MAVQKLQYARTKSDAVAKFDGSWRKDKRTRLQQPGIHAISSAAVPKESADRPNASALPAGRVEDVGEPNSILFIENLPEATTADMLAVLFKQFPGKFAS